ncbi:hypothetical protein LC607_27415 [Nostoc sp. CHAB 5824]|nr:hypothetical protein [Nostoc sp. CHAB 5824]
MKTLPHSPALPASSLANCYGCYSVTLTTISTEIPSLSEFIATRRTSSARIA